MLLVGSKALEYYIPLNRLTHDWDIWMSDSEFKEFHEKNKQFLIKESTHSILYEIRNEILEITPETLMDITDKEIFFNSQCMLMRSHKFNDGILPSLGIPNIQVIYDMKWATALCIDEPKHMHDVHLMRLNFPHLEQQSDLFKRRHKETEARVQKSKKVKQDFFHKYHIPEYIYHDNLHVIIADLLDINIPTYKRITDGDVSIAQSLFDKLTHDQKISLMVEESLVLCLERWINPQMIENGINAQLIDIFYNNNEGLPSYQILKHCCITGLKGEAEYIVNFARENFFEIEKQWQLAKKKIKSKGGFPDHFYKELYNLRDKYKAGENVDKGVLN